jgi:hypothetical protein
VPYIFWNFGVQILQQPKKITILYDQDHEFRQVRNKPASSYASNAVLTHSIGYYEPDTLVIDTVGIKVDRPFAMMDMFGAPYSPALHVVERFRLIDYETVKEAQDRTGKRLFRLSGAAEGCSSDPRYRGKGLQLEFTVEDEGALRMPWAAIVTYRRLLREWPEEVCAENLCATYFTRDSAAPQTSKPDF